MLSQITDSLKVEKAYFALDLVLIQFHMTVSDIHSEGHCLSVFLCLAVTVDFCFHQNQFFEFSGQSQISKFSFATFELKK